MYIYVLAARDSIEFEIIMMQSKIPLKMFNFVWVISEWPAARVPGPGPSPGPSPGPGQCVCTDRQAAVMNSSLT